MYRPEGSPMLTKDKVKSESDDASLDSPGECSSILDPSHLPDDSNDEISILIGSPSSEVSGISDRKLSMYSPSQEQFSIPEDIGTEAQTNTALSSPAVSDVQGAKHYLNEPEYPIATTSEHTSYFSPSSSTSRSYSFSEPSATRNPLVSPSTYPAAFNTAQAFPAGSTDGMMTSAMYPNGACMSPSPYHMSPYGPTGKQYTWPSTTPNAAAAAYGAFGMNSHDLAGYSSTYPSTGPYTQMAAMHRQGYPTAYFPSQVTATTHAAT